MKESPEKVQKDREEAFPTRENRGEVRLLNIIEIEEVVQSRDPRVEVLLLLVITAEEVDRKRDPREEAQ